MYVCIVVCTYNRSELLEECLLSLKRMLPVPVDWEVIVVDNNSDDNTESVVRQLMRTFPKLSYVKELKQGLSHARNCGAHASKAEWVLYHDDDALAHSDLLTRFVNTSSRNDFDCIGGKYLAWFRNEKPAWWPVGAGEKEDPREDFGPIEYPQLSGGIFACKRELLLSMGGFNPDLGQLGEQLRYGEEVELQAKLLEAGYKIAYDPLLRIDHLVAKEKMSVSWILKSRYKNGVDFWQTHRVKKPEYYSKKMNFIFMSLRIPIQLISHGIKRRMERTFLWQRWIIESLDRPALEYGKFKALDFHSTELSTEDHKV